ncbi:ubiquitin carboxyl-terminal hydrolase 48 isoform X5 [Lagopus muta]|uniref:ubiquitin carboxyl-terminal hydrolase 48 isoform X5 n=1 Tax=Lagopus muta TaxID=64668 RepID=UPI00209F9614|nr:ubiquitin carboxyl-terminal hydrolase 48 isoform X5 [Lagopus muta]
MAPVAPRLQLEKAAWRWTETVPPEAVSQEHVEAAYRVRLEPCQRGACRRNCRGNPNCLVGIGEHVWLGEIDENSFHNIDDPNCERRKEDAFVGLKNLGATCYVNTFLQMWFLNLEFRQALYLCSSNEHTVRKSIPKDEDYEPQTICEHLQYLFALLQNSRRRYIDPSGFVKALGLDTGQQQDAQEFSKLFMSLLEDTLSKQKNPDVQNIVQKQFCGEYVYVTVCNQCGRESKLVSKFYELELNIQGHKQLTDCITEFLKEEKLEGDNRYFCETCQSKQNATRKIRLLSLPCTLNLQLMRFVFDRQTGHKKKLNTYIGFSELLDMKPFMEQKNGAYVYKLSAVLIHRGVSAYSGHYIAHVKDPQTGEWYKFNDEDTEKMEGKKLQLGIEEDLAEPSKSQTRKPKCGKGTHCSCNAYMLVYRQQIWENSLTVEVPDGANEEKREEEEELNFNEDIVCPHGDLCISENERRVVSKEAWKKLKQYFPKAPEFPNNKECCSQCKILEREGEENKALHKMMASEQKTSLQNLFHDKCRPCLGSWPQETDELYIVSQFFVEEWRKFVRRPTRCSPVSSLGNSALLCPHGGLMFSYASMTKEDSKLIALIWPSEWERIQKLFVVDHVIKITRTQVAGEPESALYSSEPQLCPECREGLLCQQQRDLREYTQATIYIHKVVDNKKVMKDAAPELNVSSSEAEEEREENKPEGEQDPDFNQSNGGAKRQKLSHQSHVSYQKQGIRRSTRHRKVRGEKALLVSANQTLKELKIQIMHAFSVAPFDQNLSINGKILSDDTATLGSLGVIPESVILLKADEPIADYEAMDDVMQVCTPEEGFKGTGLLGH